ncbi:MAG: Asp-tRNA(Asn)/Glu-tRNA(Gln) amidotransferase subunit GatC [bacterium]|nr:Asp-tRNA(Asn)/Glu-tRNA(Gln) amidotransferase subunit GatC [bacterium]
MVTETDIEKLALLARVALSEQEKEKLRTDVEAILEYVSDIRKVSGGEERAVPSLVNVMREDGTPHEGGVHTETLLSLAPKREGQYVRVKKIL